MITLGIIAVLVLVAAISVSSLFPYPWHASCKLTWSAPVNCATFEEKLVSQIEAWSNNPCPMTSDTCPKMPCGQKCKYKLVSSSGSQIVAEHRTPVADYMDKLTFDLSAKQDSCTVNAFSTADTWYAVLDFGTNYCNLRNLADGAGLTSIQGFEESTELAICTQYDDKNCERF